MYVSAQSSKNPLKPRCCCKNGQPRLTLRHTAFRPIWICAFRSSLNNRQCLFSYRTTSDSWCEVLIIGSLQKIEIRVLVLGWFWMKLTARTVLQGHGKMSHGLREGGARVFPSVAPPPTPTPTDILTSPKLLSILKEKQGRAIQQGET